MPTKAEMINDISEATEVSKSDVEKVVDDLVGIIIDIVAEGDEITLPRLGKFTSKHRPERTGRNPSTQQTMTIAAKTVPVFKPAKAFKEFVDV